MFEILCIYVLFFISLVYSCMCVFFLVFPGTQKFLLGKDNFHLSLASFTMPGLMVSKEQHVKNDNCGDDDYDYDSN